jgi:hypothetical protein
MFQRPAIIALTEPPARWADAALDDARSERSSSLDRAAVSAIKTKPLRLK